MPTKTFDMTTCAGVRASLAADLAAERAAGTMDAPTAAFWLGDASCEFSDDDEHDDDGASDACGRL